MMETPRAMLNAGAVAAAHPRLAGFVLGTNDLVKELGAAHTPDRLPLVASLGLCLLAARAEGLVCVDGVFNAFQDQEGLRAACVQGREMGFDGKTLIHPDQIAVANEVFAPSADDLALAARAGRGLRGGGGARRGGGGGERADRREPARGDGAAAAGARRGDRRAGGGAMTLLVLGLILWTLVARLQARGAGRPRAAWTRRWAPGPARGVMAVLLAARRRC